MTPLPSLHQTARKLAQLCDVIDDAETVDSYLVSEFKNLEQGVALAVDNRRQWAAAAKGFIEMAKERKREAESQIKSFENVLKRIKSITLHTLESNPELTFRDSLGKKLSIGKSKKLKLTCNTRTRNFSNVLDPLESSMVPGKYLQEVTLLTLNTAAVKADLEAGNKLDFAFLEENKHVRGL
jgi:hypothetical protein